MKRLALLLGLLFILGSAQSQNLELYMSSDTVESGDPVNLDITVKNFIRMGSASATITWNPNVLRLDSTSHHHMFLGATLAPSISTVSAAQGSINFNWTTLNSRSGESMNDGDRLFRLNFTAIGASGSSTHVLFDSVPVPLVWAGTLGQKGPIQGSYGFVQLKCDPANSPLAKFGTTPNSLNVSFHDSSSNHPTNWMWDFGDGTTDTSQNPMHSYRAPGMYNVCLIVSSICGTDTFCQRINVMASSINQNLLANAINVFPNPSKGLLRFIGTDLQGTNLRLIDVKGQTVLALQGLTNNELDISQLPSGIYLLELRTEQGSIRKRIVLDQ